MMTFRFRDTLTGEDLVLLRDSENAAWEAIYDQFGEDYMLENILLYTEK